MLYTFFPNSRGGRSKLSEGSVRSYRTPLCSIKVSSSSCRQEMLRRTCFSCWRLADQVSEAVANLWAAKPCDGRKAGRMCVLRILKASAPWSRWMQERRVLAGVQRRFRIKMNKGFYSHSLCYFFVFRVHVSIARVPTVVCLFLVCFWYVFVCLPPAQQTVQVAWARLGVFLFEQLPKAKWRVNVPERSWGPHFEPVGCY